MALHPAGDAVVVSFLEVHPMADRRIIPADTVFRPGPDAGVGHALNAPALQPGMLPLDPRDFGENLIVHPLHALVGHVLPVILAAAVQFQDAVKHPVRIDGPPAAGKGPGIAPVEAAVNPPAGGRLEGRDHVGEFSVRVMVGVVPEFLEELALVHVPVAVEPGFPLLGRLGLQLLDVVRLLFHEGLVVRHQALDEHVIRRVFVRSEPAFLQPLDVLVPRPAGVAGHVHAFGKAVGPAQAGHDGFDLVFRHLGGLVNGDHVVFVTLNFHQIAVLSAEHELDAAAVGEAYLMGQAVVPGHARKLGLQGLDVVFQQLRVAFPHDEHADAGIFPAQ